MTKVSAYILFVVFSTFLVCISVDFSTYLQILNAGASVEDVTTMPEEHHEDGSGKLKHDLRSAYKFFLASLDKNAEYFINQKFQLTEQIYFDVPYSPPDLV